MILLSNLLILASMLISVTLPEDLREIASDLGCREVEGFHDRPGMVEPEYLYGYFEGPKEESVVFWCQDVVDGRYRFVAVKEGTIDSFNWQNFPGGLSMSAKVEWDLSRFRSVEDGVSSGLEGKTVLAPIQAEYDGVITLFYPVNGVWFYRILH
jgi:hypothetical protein